MLWLPADFFLNYDLLLEWAGYHDRLRSGKSPQISVAIRLLSQMEDEERTRTLELLESFWADIRPN